MVIILILLQDYIIFAQCVNFKTVSHLKEIHHNNTIFKCSKKISDSKAKLAFDAGANYLINNPKPNLSLCKYLNVEKQSNSYILKNFDLKSPYSHPNCLLGEFNNLLINQQLSHQDLKGFKRFSDKDVLDASRPQNISESIHIYNNYNQLFLNLNNLSMNEKLQIFENYNLFLKEIRNPEEVEKFLQEYHSKLINNLALGFNIK